MKKRYEAIIIGAGVIGAAIALELSKKGYRVFCIDKNSEPGAGTTATSCAIVRAHYSTYDGVAMAYESFSYWLDWENYVGVRDQAGLAKYMDCGSAFIKSPAYDYERILKLYRQLGVAFEDWDLAEFKKRAPYYSTVSYHPTTRPENDPEFWNADRPGEIEGAIFAPEAGYVDDPKLATHNLMVAAQAQGATFLFNHAIKEIRRNSEKVLGVTLDDGSKLDAPIVVNAGGAFSFVVNRMAGVDRDMKIRTRALRKQVTSIPAPAGMDFEQSGFHITDPDNGSYLLPEPDNRIMIGSVDPECDPKQWIEDPADFDRNVDDDQWLAQVSRLVRKFKGTEIPTEKSGYADLYDVSDDWIPIYDKSGLDGFYMAIGTSGNQFKTAPVVGRCMAELIDRCQNGHDHDCDPVEATMHYSKRKLDLGQYTRLRQVNPDSSFSVYG